MSRNYRSLLVVMTLALSLGTHVKAGERTALFAPDQFGYSATAVCPMQWVDISDSGSALSFTAAAATVGEDDGGAVLSLVEPFEFYSAPYHDLIVSSNGYVGFAAALTEENGGDFSNDCPLPAVPDNGSANLGRIAVLHDDLQAGTGGGVFSAYLAPCPRAGSFAGEACTVVQWHNWERRQQPGTLFSFQVLLYHQSRAIVTQYQNATAIATESISVGLQSPALDSALMLGCNSAGLVPVTGAWCAGHPVSAEVFLASGFE